MGPEFEVRVMKRTKVMRLGLMALALFGLTSCVEKIDLEEIAEIRVVVEGKVIYGENAWVKLSKTVNKTAVNSFPPVLDAEVNLTGSDGNSELLVHVGEGIYQSVSLKGKPATHYQLEVRTRQGNFSGSSTMPARPVMIDSVQHQYQLTLQGDTINSILSLFFTDPAGEPTFGFIKLEINGVPLGNYYFYDDQGADGQYQRFDILLKMILQKEDIVKTKFFHVEEIIRDFFQKVAERDNTALLGGLTVAPPENLQGNLNGEALGYFAAMTQDSTIIVVD